MKLKHITPSAAFTSLSSGIKVYNIEREEVHAISPNESYFLDASFKVGAEYIYHDDSIWTVMTSCTGIYFLVNKKVNRVYSSTRLSREELQGDLDRYFKANP